MILIGVGTKRAATVAADETTVLVIAGPPGAALPVSPFEHWYAAEPAYLAGDYDRAFEVAAAGLADYPDHPTLNYQLACYRALAGDTEAALRALPGRRRGQPRSDRVGRGRRRPRVDPRPARLPELSRRLRTRRRSAGSLGARVAGCSRSGRSDRSSAIAPATAITATPPPALRMIAQRRLTHGRSRRACRSGSFVFESA